LLPLGCVAVVNPSNAVHLDTRVGWFWGRFAAQREQAPSPQKHRYYCKYSPANKQARTHRNTLLGIAQVIMLGELAVNRALDNFDPPP
jgi:hypothetical protein